MLFPLLCASLVTVCLGRSPSRSSPEENLLLRVDPGIHLTYPKGKDTRAALPRLECDSTILKSEDSVTGLLFKQIPKLERDFGLTVRLGFQNGHLTSCDLAPSKAEEAYRSVCLPPTDNQNLVCPEGWMLIEESCFLLSKENEKGTWEQGVEFCGNFGGSLATIASSVQHGVLASILKDQSASDTWIGLNDLKAAGTFDWQDGSVLNYKGFADGQPDNSGQFLGFGEREECVEMKRDYYFQWNDDHCDSINRFLCSITAEPAPTTTTTTTSTTTTTTTTTTTPTTTTTKPPSCEDGWEMNRDSCYKVSFEKASWSDASEGCQAMGATLASVADEEENDFIMGLLEDDTWIGISDQEEEGVFKSLDGQEMSYGKWGENEPNNGKGFFGNYENCVEMLMTIGFRWNDEDCDKPNQYVCERSPQ